MKPTRQIKTSRGVPLTQYQCVKCGDWKTRDLYAPSKAARDGLQSYCKACQRAVSGDKKVKKFYSGGYVPWKGGAQ